MLRVILNHCPSSFFVIGLLIQSGAHRLAGIIGQQAPRNPPVSALNHYNYKSMLPHTGFYVVLRVYTKVLTASTFNHQAIFISSNFILKILMNTG